MSSKQQSVLKQHGFAGSLGDFRQALTEVKDANFPGVADEELTDTRDEADDYCTAVRKRSGLADLPRPFILRCLIGVRKHPVKA